MNVKKGKYTYTEIGKKKVLIRYSNENDSIEDTFDTYLDCKVAVSNRLIQDIFISMEILRDLF